MVAAVFAGRVGRHPGTPGGWTRVMPESRRDCGQELVFEAVGGALVVSWGGHAGLWCVGFPHDSKCPWGSETNDPKALTSPAQPSKTPPVPWPFMSGLGFLGGPAAAERAGGLGDHVRTPVKLRSCSPQDPFCPQLQMHEETPTHHTWPAPCVHIPHTPICTHTHAHLSAH